MPAPVVVTLVAAPVLLTPSSTTVLTRPPHSPLPSRTVMRSRFKVPTAGYRCSMSVAFNEAVQECTGLGTAPSQSSRCGTRYGVPPSVDQPPLLLENSAKIGAPLYVRTAPVVACTASVVDAGSRAMLLPSFA